MATRSFQHDKIQTTIYKNVRDPTQQDVEYDEVEFADQPLEGYMTAQPEQSTNDQVKDKTQIGRRVNYSVRRALIIGFVLQMIMTIAISSLFGFYIVNSHRDHTEQGSQIPARSNSSLKDTDKDSIDEERQKFEEKMMLTITSKVDALRGEIGTLIKNYVVEERQKFEEEMMSAITSKVDAEIRTSIKSGSVAFFVHSPNGTTIDSRPIFREIITNIGGGYDQNEAKFVCPRSGLYSFNVAFRTIARKIDCYMTKNGNSLAFIGTDGDNGNYNMASQSIFVQLSVGDVFAIQECIFWQHVHGASGSTFSGALIG